MNKLLLSLLPADRTPGGSEMGMTTGGLASKPKQMGMAMGAGSTSKHKVKGMGKPKR